MKIMKTCCKCKVEKPLEEFHKAKSRKDGHGSYCRQCTSKYDEERRKGVIPQYNTTKICTKCGIEKSGQEFYKETTRKDGLGSQCKLCVSKHCKKKRELAGLTKKILKEELKERNGKICCKCGLEKPLVQFSKNKNTKDGYQHICKHCRRKYDQEKRDLVRLEKKLKEESKDPTKKICTKCRIEKSIEEFYKSTKSKDGLCFRCKECVRNYAQENRDRLIANKRMRYQKNKEHFRAKDREQNAKEKSKIRKKKYDQEHKEQRSKRKAERYKNDIQYRLRITLRGRLKAAVKNNQKAGSAVKDLGCSIEYLKQYLEDKFTEGMSWSKFGKFIHIDHITPLASFDLTERDQFLKACHYKNLQPLWAKDNLSKGDSLDWEPSC